MSVKAAYVKGFLDAEGCVEDYGIKVNQKLTKVGIKNIRRLYWLLNELGIKCSETRYESRSFVYIRIPALREAANLKLFQTLVGFTHEGRTRKLSELIGIYEGKPLAGQDLLKNKVVARVYDAPMNHFDLMKTFNLKRSAARRVTHALIEERRIVAKKVNGKYLYSTTI